MATAAFARQLAPEPHHTTVQDLLETFLERGRRWDALPQAEREALHKFDAHLFASACARRFVDAPTAIERIERTQGFLVKTAVTALAESLDAVGEQVLELIETRGLQTVWHHVQRELVDAGADHVRLYEASGACRIAAFALEDLVMDTTVERTAEQIVRERDVILERLLDLIDVDSLKFGAPALALLYVASVRGLGDLDDSTETESF